MSVLETGRELSRQMAGLAARWAVEPGLEREYWTQFRSDRPGSFVERHGHLQHRLVMSGPMRTWRLATLEIMSCEISPRHKGPGYVFDHCHDHGWVRAVVCPSCNVKLGQLDAARKLAGITVMLGDTGFGRVAARCPYCVPDHARHGCPLPTLDRRFTSTTRVLT